MLRPEYTAPGHDGLPIPTSVPGVFLSPPGFERVIGLLREGIGALAGDEPFHRLSIPPVISRATIEHAGYARTFPQLLGTVHGFHGTPKDLARLTEQGAWHAEQRIGDLVLLPAACYPVYATMADTDLCTPARMAVEATCFRQEATSEPGRLRSFRMLELVTAGDAEHCVKWRAHWLDRTSAWFDALGLSIAVDVADDPFFGPTKKFYQAAQRKQELKLELRTAVADGTVQAVASANYHKDHFGTAFGFTAGGSPGHTACLAFGLERLALALINAHGADAADVLSAGR